MDEAAAERRHWFVPLCIFIARTLLNLFSRWRVVGIDKVPAKGPLLIVCNHQNNADPPILVAVVPRIVHVMAKHELFRGPAGVLSRWYGAFPVRRGEPDREAIRTALAYLESGSAVAMFPEGTRSRNGQLQQGRLGAGLLAIRSGATILPVAITGSGRLRNLAAILRRPEIEIRIGAPFSLARHEGSGRTAAAAEATDAIMRAIAALLPADERGRYAEQAVVASTPSSRR